MRARKNHSSSTSVQGNTLRIRGLERALKKPKDVVTGAPVLPLLAWAEIEEWQRDNVYIHSGYRSVSNSYTECLGSWFSLHNETVNIHTHLLGVVAVLPIWCYIENAILPAYKTTTSIDSAVIAINCIGAAICFGASTTYHTLMNHSNPVAARWLLIDFVGILAFIVGSFYPGVYYGFFCEPVAMYSYWTMITILGGGCVIACTVPVFRTPKWRTFRTVMFAGVALSGLLPIAHGVMLHGAEKALRDMGAMWYLIEAVFYIIGAFLYGLRFPECTKPGGYDIWGHAHQIMHISVLLGALCHLRAILVALDYNHNPITRRC